MNVPRGRPCIRWRTHTSLQRVMDAISYMVRHGGAPRVPAFCHLCGRWHAVILPKENVVASKSKRKQGQSLTVDARQIGGWWRFPVARGAPIPQTDGDVAVAERPAVRLPPKPQPGRARVDRSMSALAEYADVAERIGLVVPELVIGRLRTFLAEHNLPVYDLKTVVAYMDALALRDNATGWGWQWKPLRQSDADRSRRQQFGAGSGTFHVVGKKSGELRVEHRPASDYYNADDTQLYDRRVPLHALKRVALIEEKFRASVVFAVSDYTVQPHIQPDPFLMVFVPNPKLGGGVGRFIIDVWDEPGFGIDLMIK